MKKALLAATVIAALTACNSNQSKETNPQAPVAHSEVHDHDDHDGDDHSSGPETEAMKATMSLNNGEKWQANPETTANVGAMDETLDAFIENTSPTEAEYRAFGAKMSELYNTIFRQCTMKGEAHEMLHTYLMPMKDQLDILNNGSVEDCAKAVERLHKRLHIYAMYFES